MGKRGKSSKKDMRNPKRRHRDDDPVDPENIDDEIDVCKFNFALFFVNYLYFH